MKILEIDLGKVQKITGRKDKHIKQTNLSMGKYGFSFSWKRAIGITAVKQRFARETGIPTSAGGMERKIGKSVLGLQVGLFFGKK